MRRQEARREAVPIQRPANPAETEGDLVRRLEFRLCGKAAKRFEIGVPIRTDVLRALDVVEPPGELALKVTDMLKKGCEIPASPQSKKR